MHTVGLLFMPLPSKVFILSRSVGAHLVFRHHGNYQKVMFVFHRRHLHIVNHIVQPYGGGGSLSAIFIHNVKV